MNEYAAPKTDEEIKNMLDLANQIASGMIRGHQLADRVYDAAVDGYLNAVKNYDPERGKFKTLMTTCVRNCCVNLLRNTEGRLGQKRARREEYNRFKTVEAYTTPDLRCENDEMLSKALKSLTPDVKTVMSAWANGTPKIRAIERQYGYRRADYYEKERFILNEIRSANGLPCLGPYGRRVSA